jgi:hypothetical protein
MEIKKPYAVFQCKLFMKGIDMTDSTSVFTRFYERCKMVEKSGTVSAKL